MSNFPPLRLAVLSGLIGLKDQLDTLDEPTCPYDDETKQALRDLLAPKIVEKVVEKEVPQAGAGRGRPTKDIKLDAEDQKKVLDEIKSTIEVLNAMGSGEGLPTNERIQIAKTKSGLLDQQLKMMERHTTVQKMEAFKETVIGILNDLVSESDREIFLKRVEPFR